VLSRGAARQERRAPWSWVDVVLILLIAFLFGGAANAGVASVVHHADASLGAQDRVSVEALGGQLAFYGVALSVTLLVLAGRRGLDVGALGWRRPSLSWLLAAVPLTLLGLAVAGLLAGFAQTLLPHTPNEQCIKVQQQYGHSVLLALPVVCLAAPVVEETVFRGVVYRWLRGAMPLGAAMLASAAVFALAHAITLLFLPLLGLGVLLAWVYERSGSLWPGVLVHALFNLAGIIDILTATRCQT
jgi:membrane protease YdiL (CAAX protease family)